MSSTRGTAGRGADGPPQDGSAQLQRGAIGTAAIVFFVVAAVGPMGGAIGPSPIGFANSGAGTAGAYLVSAIILLLFSVGFAAMSRHVSSAGGFAVVIARGLGERAGFSGALLAVVAYNGLLIGLYGFIGTFAHDIMSDLFGISAPWWVWSAIVLGLVGVLGLRQVNVSARLLGLVLFFEVMALVVLAAVVLVDGGPEGLTLEPFNPATIFSGSVGITLLFACLSYVGFEATTIYGEEARDPQRDVPRATYAAVLLIGAFFVLVMYAITVAYGAGAVRSVAMEDPEGMVFAIGSKFIGAWYADFMKALLLIGVFAVVLAFHNTLSRYLFSLGRAKFLPPWLGHTHATHRAPQRASLVQTGLATVIVTAFLIAGADPYAELYSWFAGVGTLGILALQAIASLAVIGFFRRTRLERNPWKTTIAPLLGFAGLAVVVVLAVVNFDALVGADSGIAVLLPWAVPLVALIGLLLGVSRSRKGASLYDAFEDAHDERIAHAETLPAGESVRS